jgi:hypothetical protein
MIQPVNQFILVDTIAEVADVDLFGPAPVIYCKENGLWYERVQGEGWASSTLLQTKWPNLQGKPTLPEGESSGLSGWIDYADTQYTVGSPLTIAANTPTIVPNNAGNIRNAFKPNYVDDFYEDGVIFGHNGNAFVFTLECVVVPTNPLTTWIDFWIDIGAPVGELYRRITTFPKGLGEERPITLSTAVYTLSTWEANGGVVYCEAPNTASIYNIRYVFHSLHRAA